ncbi:hypothetical protein A2617_01770 [Candidatus Daviesbacteria bacterium RIFOXYD1_FULL_41_10]|uniref:RNase H type-1 domain-containing protein n=2 Tax=Candidatus Daviesiibacteriota TaxID=1752718 RepID=A0A1F5MZL5_9BACT|nr:MAG: Ribonuclease H [Candidatus Daviesbacteria bacterium GW2011_GWB1_41_5]OGE70792.1 MAG: hypothetical protein A2617_01770 [Candidatus Daviesbacteria bacterium RIFOXYD1_FULL_41_10]
MRKIVLFTDGGSRNNPGKAAAAYVIYEDGQKVYEDGNYLGIATNNEAEYEAVKLGLGKLMEMGRAGVGVEVRCDSRLAVEQLRGNFKVKNPRMKALVEGVKTLEQNFSRVSYVLIPREENFQADFLVNQTLDRYQ